ncbi:P-loop containing nucleoside triphosphate hydrolase protein [Blastocladiella britannica]|nr:P-loop containing nucleoside triphosphate hydrolase protein [Blastocladiella britannica]
MICSHLRFLLPLRRCSATIAVHLVASTTAARAYAATRAPPSSSPLDVLGRLDFSIRPTEPVPPPIQQQQQHLKPLELRPYQRECIDATLAARARGLRRMAVSLPVGAGKTVVFSTLIRDLPAPVPRATKVLVLAHRAELLDQAVKQIRRACPELNVVLDSGPVKKTVANLDGVDVVVASVTALGRTGSTRLAKYNPNEFKCIVIDEAHHAAAVTYARILAHFDVRNPASHVMVWGCSATLKRADALSLGDVFDEVIYHRGFLEMIRDGHLCDFRVHSVHTPTSLASVPSVQGDYAVGALARAINTPERTAAVLQAWRTVSDQRMATLVFAADVQHVDDLVAAFEAQGVEARGIHSQMELSPKERADLVQGFREGKVPVLVNCGILTEGTDLPNVDCIVLARPTRSSVLYQQMLGRGLRLHSSKADCLVLDVVDQHTKADIITVPSLLGLTPEHTVTKDTLFTDLAQTTAAEAESAEDETEEDGGLLDQLFGDSGLMFEDVVKADPAETGDVQVELVGNAESMVAAHVRRAAAAARRSEIYGTVKSRFDWFLLKPKVLALQLPSRDELRIDFSQGATGPFRVEKHFKVLKPDGSHIRTHQSLHTIQGDSITSVVAACDTWVKSNFKSLHHLASRAFAARSGPRSDKQAAYLTRLGYLSLPDGRGRSNGELRERREAQLNAMTKADAAKIISMVLAGTAKEGKKMSRMAEKTAAAARTRRERARRLL